MLGRTSARAARSTKQFQRTRLNARFQSTTSAPPGNPALVGGLAGGAAAFATGYAWYHFSGTKKLVASTKQTQEYIEQAKRTIAEKAPEPNEAYNWLKETVQSYARFIPGASGYVDTAFDDLEKIRKDHGQEFDSVISEAYTELRDLTRREGLSAASAGAALEILQKYSKKLFDLAGDAAGNVLENHPKIKEKVGGGYEQLKEMGEAYGPKAKEEVNRTWGQISEIVQKGFSVEGVEEIKRLIEEKKKTVQKFGEEAWEKGMKESQGYLEKNPKVKELIEENADALKKGNFKDLWGLAKEGKTEEVEKWVREKVDQAKNTDLASLDQWLELVPGGSKVIPQLQSLREIAQKKGGEAETVLKETLEEVREVLEKRKDQVEKLAEEGKKESK